MRTFFAIELSKASQAELADYLKMLRQQLEKTYQAKHFRWVQADKLHLTLQFLGRLEDEHLLSLLQKARDQVCPFSAFKLKLGPLEWFPSPDNPHVLSLQVQPTGGPVQLALALGKAISAQGYSVEDRPFRPHLTLARLVDLQKLEPARLEKLVLPVLSELNVKEVVLFRSELQESGSVYTRLAGLELQVEPS